MYMMLTMIMLILTLSMLLMLISLMLSKKNIYDREKMSPFECGFDPKSYARLPFSLRFFLIAIIFLIFDVEITLIMPIILTMNLTFPTSWMMTLTFFIMILIMGLYHEWNQGALEWIK